MHAYGSLALFKAVLHNVGAMNHSSAPMPSSLPRNLLESAATAVLWFDTRQQLGWLNPAAEDLLGISLLGGRRPEAERLFADTPALCEAVHRVRERRERVSLWDCQLTLPGNRGEQRVDVIITPLEDEGLLLELVSRERPKRIMDERQQQGRRDAARQLVRGLAHEIRNPLGGMRGAVQLLARRLPDPALKVHTDVILAEADRIGSLVDRLLGPDHLNRRPVNIHEPLEHVRHLVEAEAPQGIRIQRDYDPSLPECRADQDQLVQVFLNIARNALQAMGDEGHLRFSTCAVRQVTFAGRRHRIALCVQIADDGPGIPPDLRDSLFYPLVSGRPDGDGLGLAISNELVARHQGLIEVDSRPGATCFTLYLPLETLDE
ncbi:two-component system nitrogen regulation sensor histidine kinase GlnL [Natronospira proteinivora]|uniref:Sensory histidine kinase/phosphatase NtrB n=1 Tax=Natronospira proteinivora TaxID=1807133 RepID=A0ABT1GA27_9GAMM|nr:nitrogen regulation protein NR(II) [Natronospira proteinivora]MCP1728154.1 two-component system nitrogen regulation sensor histidine kinase GlnL [Natronospira proteinivora]